MAAVERAEAFADSRANREELKAGRRAVADAVEEARREADEAHQKSMQDHPPPEWASALLGAFAERMDWGGGGRHTRVFRDPPEIERAVDLVSPLLVTRNIEPASLTTVALAAARWAADSTDERLAVLDNQCQILRDIFGNPFRPVVFNSAWRASSAVQLATQMYGSRDFAHMPILADALQDAGCEQPDVLTHCRDPHAVHVRGCWVVDLELGKG